jgi:hypothetical protein
MERMVDVEDRRQRLAQATARNATPTRASHDPASRATAAASAQLLAAQARNIAESAHAWSPFAYSLTIRQDGANSGLSTCSAARKASASTAPAMAIRAATGGVRVAR